MQLQGLDGTTLHGRAARVRGVDRAQDLRSLRAVRASHRRARDTSAKR
jgi:hypothetical protein